LLGSALLYAPTRFFHEANPVWRLTSLLWAVEVVVITLVLLRFAFQTSHFALRTSHFAFPVCFILVAVPWPSGLESFLVQTLTRLNVSATVEVLGWFGIPALQHANVIEVATGDVGIDEACSGIRSFQATLMISLFFGEFYRLNVARRAVCVLAGFALSFLFNMARTTLLTWVAAKKGVAAIANWHDPAGVTILVVCFLTLWLAAVWLRGKSRKQKAESRKQKPEVRSPISDLRSSNSQLSTARRLAVALLAWFVLVEAGTQLWFRLHENSAASRVKWSVNVEGTNRRLTKVEIPANISAQFRYDEGFQANGKDDNGNLWQIYYFRWFPAHFLNKRVAIQLAKTHGPEICLRAIGMTLKSDLGVITVPVGNMQFAFRQYVFLADGQPLHVFYAIYEDPSGSAVLANRRQDTASRIAAALAGSRNDGQSFLEVAVAGPENPEEAKAVFAQQLNKMVKIDKP
jgi:exosortase